MRKFLLLTIITLLIGVIVPNKVVAKNWTDVVTSQPEGYVIDVDGNVTISSAEGLAWLVSVVNGLNGQNPDSFEAKIVKLVSDIDLSDNYWDIPIGSENSLFKGTFNGAGFEIYNLSVVVSEETSDYHALFGYVENANIKNVGIVGCSIESYNSSACLAYSIYNTVIENCYSSGDIYCYGDGSVAGLVVISKNSTILNCYTWIENMLTYYGEFVGGLAGYFEQSTMKNCYSASHWIGSYSDKSYVGTLGGYRQSCYLYNAHGWANGNHTFGYFDDETNALNTQQMLFDSYENRWYLLDYPYIATFNEGETNDLLTALNYGVMDIGEDGLRYWQWSEGNDVCYETYGLPVFGDYFTTSCAAPIFVEAETVSVGDNLSVRLSWVDTCDAHAWEIQCVEKLYGVIDTIIIADTNSYLIENLIITEDQQIAVYEFKVRTLCDEIYHSKWSDSKLVSFTWNIDENEAENLEIYPNPANDVINIKGVDVNSIHIYNVQGQLLTKKDCELGSDASIDISFLESGLYLMQIYCGSNVINRTFVKK